MLFGRRGLTDLGRAYAAKNEVCQQCPRFWQWVMFAAADAYSPKNVEKAQVCIIGSGPAGITLAYSLARYGVSVVLVEAGARRFREDSQDFYRGQVVGNNYFDLSACRLRMFGGTSNHWGGWCRPLDSHELNGGGISSSKLNWPVSDADLSRYWAEACRILQVSDDFEDKDVGSGIRQLNIQYGPPVIFGESYWSFFDSSKSVRVFLESTLIDVRPRNHRVHGALIRSRIDGGKLVDWWIEAEYFVLCLGGLENSRILLWLNERHRKGIVAKHDSIGRYWMEHPRAALGEMLVSERTYRLFRQDLVHLALNPRLQKGLKIGGARYTISALTYRKSQALITELQRVAPGLSEYFFRMLNEKRLPCGACFYSEWEQMQDWDNRVSLGADTDSYGIPRVTLLWRKTERDLETILLATHALVNGFTNLNLGRARLEDWLMESMDIPPQQEMAGYHHMGGTRMGYSETDSIVDPNLRVHGLQNL